MDLHLIAGLVEERGGGVLDLHLAGGLEGKLLGRGDGPLLLH